VAVCAHTCVFSQSAYVLVRLLAAFVVRAVTVTIAFAAAFDLVLEGTALNALDVGGSIRDELRAFAAAVVPVDASLSIVSPHGHGVLTSLTAEA